MRALDPDNLDFVDGYEAVARNYGHSIAFQGFGESAPGGDVGSGTLGGRLRVDRRLYVEGLGRVQHGPEPTLVATSRMLGSTTVAGSVCWDVPSLTRITTTWEQWRSNDTQIDRFTVSVVQSIP